MNKWRIQVTKDEKIIFEKEIDGDQKARALFNIKQVEILLQLKEHSLTPATSNLIGGEARGLIATMSNGQVVSMVHVS